jgi:predicted tellurium resistance membrane protein TerC
MEQIIALATLILLEIVLGIDNIIFISIVTSRLPAHGQKKARRIGLLLAMVMRLLLLTVISFILKLQGNLFSVLAMDKSSKEIHHKMEGESGDAMKPTRANTFGSVLIQILILDLVFSVDSIITAVGMVDELWIMYTAVVVSVGVMLFAAEPISKFVNKHPSFKILALSFLLLIGVSLIAEGLEFHIPKGYIYFSMAFAMMVNVFQLRTNRTKEAPVRTHEHYLPEEAEKPKDIL